MANINSFPNNQNLEVGSQNLMKFLHGRTSGVFGAENNCSVKAPLNSQMSVIVSDGVGWISNSEGDGVAWWIDAYSETGQEVNLTIDQADSYLDRIDRVVITWETTNYVALPTVSILKGTPSSVPTPPNIIRDGSKQQISLAQIKVKAGTYAITSDMITDERLDESVCGIVTNEVKVDTSGMQAEFDSFMADLRYALDGDTAGRLLNLINNKVDKVDGKGLSTNDYTATDKQNLNELVTKFSELQKKVTALEKAFNEFTKDVKGITKVSGLPSYPDSNIMYVIPEK